MPTGTRSGTVYAALAFFCWGLFPLYFHTIKDVPSMEILVHRVLWCMLFLIGVLTWRRQWGFLATMRERPKVVGSFVLSSLFLSGNWFVYIWAVNNDHVLDASLGYFINPLVNVMLGYLLLKERLRAVQWAAIGLAACGVLWLAVQAGHVPWIALILAFSFGLYGLMRKTAALGALEGLAFETIMLLPMAVAYMGWLAMHGNSVFINTPADSTRWLLVAAGPITAIPLLLFAAGARRIPLSLLGVMQYIAPTMVFLMGVWIFHEPFSQQRLIGFILIWTALAVYAGEGLWQSKRTQPSLG